MTSDQSRLQELADNLSTKILVVGCGGAGNNTVDRMMDYDMKDVDIAALNTDAQHLLGIDADQKILIGEETTGGRGAGSVPQVGQEATKENEEEIRELLDGYDLVFITAGMGGGTGTGCAPVVADLSKSLGNLTVAVVTQPFNSEGDVRQNNAEAGLQKLSDVADTTIAIHNDLIKKEYGDLPVNEAFQKADEVLVDSVRGITEMINNAGLVNIDFSDVQTVMKNGNLAMIGFGKADLSEGPSVAVQDALESELLDVDISQSSSLLVNVTGGNDMSIDEAEGVVDHLYEKVAEESRIIWGTNVEEDKNGTLETMVLVTDVESSQVFKDRNDVEDAMDEEKKKQNVPSNIDFVG